MRLTFATLRYYPYGGLEKSFLNICKEALRRGHELTIYCTSWEGEKLAGAKIIEVPVSARTNHGRVSELHRAIMAERRKARDDAFVGFKRMPDLDVYYCGDVCFANEAAEKHGPWYRLTPRYRGLVANERAVFSPGSHTHVLYISEREKNIYQSVYDTPDSRFHELPAGIGKEAIREAKRGDARGRIREQLGLDETDFMMIMVGSDFRRKGVDRALAAVAALPENERERVCLVVVGEGDVNAYRAKARRLGISGRVHFLGGRSDVPDLLAAADGMLHPALVETAGNAILEGMVAGLPVLVSASAGFSYHVERAGAGILIADRPYRQSAFNDQLKLLLQSPGLAKEYSQKGLAYTDAVDLYRRPQVAVDIIETVARSRKSARSK